MTVNELIAALSGLSDELKARPVVYQDEGFDIPIMTIVAKVDTYDDEHVAHVVQLGGWTPRPVKSQGHQLYRHTDSKK